MVTATHSPCTLEDREGGDSEQAPAPPPAGIMTGGHQAPKSSTLFSITTPSQKGPFSFSHGEEHRTQQQARAPLDPIIMIPGEELVTIHTLAQWAGV